MKTEIRKIKADDIYSLLALWSDNADVFVPADGDDGQARFEKWSQGIKVSEAVNTVRSAKDFFFPQTENLVGFRLEGKKIDIVDIRKDAEDFVVFGVRACDAKSFDILDRVFLSQPVDTFYKNRREHGTIVTLACSAAEDTCFCHTFGIDATEPGGDVSAWRAGDELYMRANTEKGEKLLAASEKLLGAAEGSDKKTLEASDAAFVHSFAPPASATISRNLIPDMESDASDVGTAVCIPTSQRWLRKTPDILSSNASARDSCTSLYISRRITKEYTAA